MSKEARGAAQVSDEAGSEVAPAGAENQCRTRGGGRLRAEKLFREWKDWSRLVINWGWLGSSDILSRCASFAQGLLVARALGPGGLGVFTLVVTYNTTISQIVDSRVWETVIKYMIEFLERGDQRKATAVFKLCMLIDLVTGALAFVLTILSAHFAARIFLKSSDAYELVLLYSFSTLITIPSGTCSALLRVANRFDWIAWQRSGIAIFKLACVAIVFFFGGGVRSFLVVLLIVAMTSSSSLVLATAIAWRALRLADWKSSSLRVLRDEWRGLGRFLLTTNAIALLRLVQRSGDMLWVGYVLSAADVGYYKLARSLADLVAFTVQPLYVTSYPELAQLWSRGKHRELARSVRRFTLLATAVALPPALILSLGGSTAINTLVGARFLPVTPLLRWLTIATTIAAVTSVGHPLLLAIGRAGDSLRALILGVIVQILTLWIALHYLGLAGAAVAYLAFYVTWSGTVCLSIRDAWLRVPRTNLN